MPLLLVAGQTFVIYVFLIVALSRVGRSLIAGLTPIGYMIIALLGSAVETALYRGSTWLSAGLVSAVTLIGADYATSFLVNHWPLLRRWLAGGPVVLIHHGQMVPSHLRQVRLTEQDLMAAIRERGYDSIDQIRFAVLEVDGSVGVVPARHEHHA
jgi:uncharacterized membrane protein YcaP (DUF421 family)